MVEKSQKTESAREHNKFTLAVASYWQTNSREKLCNFSENAHCCNQAWLLKNSLSANSRKTDRVRMPYKRFSLLG
jgi:hypothetical protein